MKTQVSSVKFDLVLLRDKHSMLQEQIHACHGNCPEVANLVRLRKEVEDEIAFLEEELHILQQQ